MRQLVEGAKDENYNPYVSVEGRGRIGSKTKAIQGHYSRSRRCWVVIFVDGTLTNTGYARFTAEELGTFKSGKLAAIAAKEFAESKGWMFDRYAQSFLPQA